jgi:hypothetical protein
MLRVRASFNGERVVATADDGVGTRLRSKTAGTGAARVIATGADRSSARRAGGTEPVGAFFTASEVPGTSP